MTPEDAGRVGRETANAEWPVNSCHMGIVPEESADMVTINCSEMFSMT